MATTTATLHEIQEIGENFYTLRAKFWVGPIDIGTQMSFIRLNSGRFVVVDTVEISADVKREIDELTQNGELIDAVVATHPFHTMYFKPFYKLYPNAKYYGTSRHLELFPSIPWVGDIGTQLNLLNSEGIFMCIPPGADFIHSEHFSAIWLFHQQSGTLHVDDTIMYADAHAGCFFTFLVPSGTMKFHLTTFKGKPNTGLYCTETAASQFKGFVTQVLHDWSDLRNIVAAHKGNLIGGAREKLQELLVKSEPQFQSHSKKFRGK